MTGVSRTLHRPVTKAYCLAPEGGCDGGPCPFFLEESPSVPSGTVYANARRHALATGHEVWVDELARTVYATAVAAVGA